MSTDPEIHTESVEHLDFEVTCCGCDKPASALLCWHGHNPEFICPTHHRMVRDKGEGVLEQLGSISCAWCGKTFPTVDGFTEPRYLK